MILDGTGNLLQTYRAGYVPSHENVSETRLLIRLSGAERRLIVLSAQVFARGIMVYTRHRNFPAYPAGLPVKRMHQLTAGRLVDCLAQHYVFVQGRSTENRICAQPGQVEQPVHVPARDACL